MKKLTIWIVGASSGIGLELTRIWLDEGHNVIAASRSATVSEPLLSLQRAHPHQLILIDIDVSEGSEIERVVQRAWEAFGSIDRWVYNAGVYEVMRMEKWSADTFDSMNAINYMGAVRLMIPLSRYFVAQGHGEWVWNLSLSAYFGLPYGGAYSAPKAALLNLAESIQPELAAQGIALRIINHGFVKTRLTRKNDFEMPQLMEPYEAARQIARQLDRTDAFEIRFPKALGRFLAFLRLLPYSLSLKLTAKTLR